MATGPIFKQTQPFGEDVLFRSSTTGEHDIDVYLEAAERGGKTLGELMVQAFDDAGNPVFATLAVTNAAIAAAGAAAASANAAEQTLDSFEATYLGAKPSDPVTDNDGNPLVAGALYLNTTTGNSHIWTGSVWAPVTDSVSSDAAAASAATALARAGIAIDKANVATTQASAASASASAAATSAGNAATSETNASASATAAAGSATAASTSAGTAGTQAGIATTKASEASASAATAASIVAAIADGPVTSVSGKTGIVTLAKADVGLGDVDNTSDLNKPISTAIQAALDLKLNAANPSYTGTLTGGTGVINNIGIPGQQGFGVGVPGTLPSGFAAMTGSTDVTSQNYGNYQFSDGSVMCYVPAFFYKWGTGANGLAVNDIDIKPFAAYASVAEANAAGYALHRAFYNAGYIRPGVFVDKYQCSNNGGVASSIKNGNPLSSAADHNPFSALTGAPANNYGGALAAAKTRGAWFFCNTRFIFAALALLAYAHGRAATSTTHCAWYDATGVSNFPKGNNNNALGDANDAAIAYVSDGYSNCGKTGSANFFARTTHNGQWCGVADLNGNMWEVNTGLTSNGSEYYALKTSIDVSTLTGGNTLITDAWGATGIAANYDSLGATYESLQARSTLFTYGSATPVFSPAVSGNAWTAAGAGVPLVSGTTGSNAFGNDGLWDYRPNELCVVSGGNSDSGSSAGSWTLHLASIRGHLAGSVGLRAASYL